MTSEWQFYLSTPALSLHEEGRGNNLLYFPFLRTLQSYSVRAEKHRDSTEVTNFLFHESHFLGTFYLKNKKPNTYSVPSAFLLQAAVYTI